MYGHQAARLFCVGMSSKDSFTCFSLAKFTKSMCQRHGMTLRRPHISIALRERSNRAASSSGPPSRWTISEASTIGRPFATGSSARQELSVPSVIQLRFQANDNEEKAGNLRVMSVREPEQIAQTALARLRELMEDMGWNEKVAVKELFRAIGQPLGIGQKAVEKWFDRGIPPGHIFNIALVLGIDSGWLSGSDDKSKAKAIVEDGLYEREVERMNRPRPKKRLG